MRQLTPQTLLRLALDRLPETPGKGKAAALARALGPEFSYQRVYRWVENRTGPDAEGCLAILERFGWLNMDADDRVDVPSIARPHPAAEAAILELAEGQRQLVDDLARLELRLTQALDLDALPSTQRRRSKTTAQRREAKK